MRAEKMRNLENQARGRWFLGSLGQWDLCVGREEEKRASKAQKTAMD